MLSALLPHFETCIGLGLFSAFREQPSAYLFRFVPLLFRWRFLSRKTGKTGVPIWRRKPGEKHPRMGKRLRLAIFPRRLEECIPLQNLQLMYDKNRQQKPNSA
ncbi:hypothetical protein [Paenibacillus sp. USDA918EY]|uniref:hypothetical protein n=1 Tax=Paenibacillus sp. USDA918EY TaxID=2689575 RepID=UPI001F2BCAE1|nr:hypothetical protein [Paenibacillus sp. USDA918EY]